MCHCKVAEVQPTGFESHLFFATWHGCCWWLPLLRCVCGVTEMSRTNYITNPSGPHRRNIGDRLRKSRCIPQMTNIIADTSLPATNIAVVLLHNCCDCHLSTTLTSRIARFPGVVRTGGRLLVLGGLNSSTASAVPRDTILSLEGDRWLAVFRLPMPLTGFSAAVCRVEAPSSA